MSNPYFAFKQFTIRQEHSAMKVGTDGVLLGAWCALPAVSVHAGDGGQKGRCRLLDIGTGTGLIALMLAQRASGAIVDAIEPDAGASRDAAANFAASPWADRLTFHRTTLQEYVQTEAAASYDHIVSNPPYYVEALHSPNPLRNLARHTVSLPYEELLEGVLHLLKPSGLFSLILPADEAGIFSREAIQKGLYRQRSLDICPTPRSGVRRVLMQWGRLNIHEAKGRLQIHEEESAYSEPYRALTRDFYLYF